MPDTVSTLSRSLPSFPVRKLRGRYFSNTAQLPSSSAGIQIHILATVFMSAHKLLLPNLRSCWTPSQAVEVVPRATQPLLLTQPSPGVQSPRRETIPNLPPLSEWSSRLCFPCVGLPTAPKSAVLEEMLHNLDFCDILVLGGDLDPRQECLELNHSELHQRHLDATNSTAGYSIYGKPRSAWWSPGVASSREALHLL